MIPPHFSPPTRRHRTHSQAQALLLALVALATLSCGTGEPLDREGRPISASLEQCALERGELQQKMERCESKLDNIPTFDPANGEETIDPEQPPPIPVEAIVTLAEDSDVDVIRTLLNDLNTQLSQRFNDLEARNDEIVRSLRQAERQRGDAQAEVRVLADQAKSAQAGELSSYQDQLAEYQEQVDALEREQSALRGKVRATLENLGDFDKRRIACKDCSERIRFKWRRNVLAFHSDLREDLASIAGVKAETIVLDGDDDD